jgi:hypothetical protein
MQDTQRVRPYQVARWCQYATDNRGLDQTLAFVCDIARTALVCTKQAGDDKRIGTFVRRPVLDVDE